MTIIFLSDGGHNSGGNIDLLLKKLKGVPQGMKINMICMGVGKGFPTTISMILKEKYHTGDSQMPALFLMEYISEKAFDLKFK